MLSVRHQVQKGVMNKFLIFLVSGLLIVLNSACVPGWREVEDSQGEVEMWFGNDFPVAIGGSFSIA